MDKNEKGYVTLLIVILIAFGFLLSGGLMSLLDQTPTNANRYIMVDPPTIRSFKTLQLATLNFLYSAPTTICIPGTDFGDEPNILYAFSPGCNETVSTANGLIKVWYTDEHALTMGVGPDVSAVPPSRTLAYPNVGDKTARDSKGFPYYPSLFLTDITEDPTSTAGDAQNGGTGIPPSLVYGTWIPLGSDADDNFEHIFGDPNTLPAAADPLSSVPIQYVNTNTGRRGTEPGFQAELIWKVSDLPVTPGKVYRAQFVIHDGDRVGDIGLGCTTILLTGN
jgi:hypothetical protein